MNITLNKMAELTIEEFADMNNLTMEINERNLPLDDPARFYAQFKDTWINGYGVLIGRYGNGATPEEAINDYKGKISQMTLIVDPLGGIRTYIQPVRIKN